MTVLKHAAWALIVCGLLSLEVLLVVEQRKTPPPTAPGTEIHLSIPYGGGAPPLLTGDATTGTPSLAGDITASTGKVLVTRSGTTFTLTPGACGQVTSEGALRNVPSCGCEVARETEAKGDAPPVSFIFPVTGVLLRGPTPAILDTTRTVPRLLFHTTTQTCASWRHVVPFPMPQGTPTLHLAYKMTSSTTGSVVFGVAIRSATTFLHGLSYALLESADLPVPDEGPTVPCAQRTLVARLTRAYMQRYDRAPLDAASFDVTTTQASVVPPTLDHLAEVSLPLLHTDGMAACHLVEVQLCRMHPAPEDTAPGDAEVVSVALEYGKTPH
jgi:hypothetical protein